MAYETILVYLLVGLPIMAEIGYLFKVLQKVTVIAAVLALITALLLYPGLPTAGTFYVTATTWVFVLMVSSIYLLSSVYSYSYFNRRLSNCAINNYYALINLFVASMLFSLTINNYGLMWGGIEATTVTSALLIMTDKTALSLEVTWRYIIIVSVGLVFAFISVILLYYYFHTLTVSQILATGGGSSELVSVAVAIALVGIGTKIGIFPMHTWLPDAHSEAPAPVSALFSGVLLPTALYVLYMIYQISQPATLFILFATATIIAASVFLAYQKNYKRMFAYSSMENMGIALLGIAIGGYGLIGALIVLFAHSFGKAGAFYSSGNILHAFDTKEISGVSGLFGKMKTTSSALLLSSFAVTGMPPFGTFIGEFLIFSQLFAMHLYLELGIVLFFMMLAFISINYNISRMVFGEGKMAVQEAKGTTMIIPILSALISLLVGVVLILVMA